MADLDELVRLDKEIRSAERDALLDLARYLREAVVQLPSQSKLGLIFVRRANKLAARARDSTPILGADW